MAIHGKQLKDASINLEKFQGISAGLAADKLLLSGNNGALVAPDYDSGADIEFTVSGQTLTVDVKEDAIGMTELDSAIVVSTLGTDNTTLPTSVAVKDYVDAQVSASGSALELTAGTGSASIALATETLTVAGGVNISTAATLNSLTVSLDPHISLTSATLSSDLLVGGNAVVNGNLTVSGTTTTVNSTIVEVADKNIVLASGGTTDADANKGGITLKGSDNKTFQWLSSGSSWTSSENIDLESTSEVYKIAGNEVLSTDGAKKVQSTVAGSGLAHDSVNGRLSVDLSGIASANINVAADSITFVDADDSSTKTESVVDLVAAMAGTATTTGIKASSGVLQVSLTRKVQKGSIATNQVDGATVDVAALSETPQGDVSLSINGILYPEGSSTSGYWYNDAGTIKWNDDGLHEAGLLLDTNDEYQIIYDYFAS